MVKCLQLTLMIAKSHGGKFNNYLVRSNVVKLSIELTAYPLEDKYLPVIEKFIEHLRSYENIKLEVYPTCSVLFGDHDDVIDALSLSIKWSVENKNKIVFVSKFLPNYKAI